jgi:Ca2+-binding RTX toxin-like protein
MIVAKGGNDTVLAMGGDDLICGGLGNDVINAGSGNDQIAADDLGFFGDPQGAWRQRHRDRG